MRILIVSGLLATVVVMAIMKMSSLCSRAEEKENEDGNMVC